MGSSSNPFASMTGSAISNQPVNSNQDPLTNSLNSTTNYQANKGQQLISKGEGTTDAGIDKLQAPMDYFGKLLNGDRASISEAIQPQADAIAQQFGQIRQMFSQTGSRGGGTTSTLAQAPYKEVQDLQDEISKARASAAQGQGSLALGESSVGLQQTGQGAGLVGQSAQNQLGVRGQDLQETLAGREMLSKGLESVFGQPLQDLTGIGLSKLPGLSGIADKLF